MNARRGDLPTTGARRSRARPSRASRPRARERRWLLLCSRGPRLIEGLFGRRLARVCQARTLRTGSHGHWAAEAREHCEVLGDAAPCTGEQGYGCQARPGMGMARRGSGDFSVVVAVLVAVLAVLAVVIVLLVAGWLWWAQGAAPAPGGPDVGPGLAARVDPALIRYIEVASWPLALSEVRALAVGREDELYVAGAEAICVLAADGQQRAKFALPGEAYCLAAAGALGEDGSGGGPLPDPADSAERSPGDAVLLYVGLSDHVEVWSAEGQRLGVWDAPSPEARFTSIAVSGAHVFVADAGSRVVWHYDRQGTLRGEIGRPDPARRTAGFLITSFHFDLGLGGDGLLYVVNPRALRLEGYTFDGHLETTLGRGAATIEGFFGCCNPAHFAVLPDGRFVTVDKGLPHVKVFDAQGRFECLVAAAHQIESLPADLAADSQGRVLVLDARQNAVRVFSPLPPGGGGGERKRAG